MSLEDYGEKFRATNATTGPLPSMKITTSHPGMDNDYFEVVPIIRRNLAYPPAPMGPHDEFYSVNPIIISVESFEEGDPPDETIVGDKGIDSTLSTIWMTLDEALELSAALALAVASAREVLDNTVVS